MEFGSPAFNHTPTPARSKDTVDGSRKNRNPS